MLVVLEAKTKKKQNFKSLANELSISENTLAVMRCRDKIPFPQVILFCKKYKVDVYWLLFEENYKKGAICFK